MELPQIKAKNVLLTGREHFRTLIFPILLYLQKKRVSFYKIMEMMYFPDRLEQANEDREKIRLVISILVGLELVELVRSGGRWRYRGPSIYQDYLRTLFDLYKKQYPCLRMPQLILEKQKVPEGALPSNRRKKLFRIRGTRSASSKQRYIEQKTKDVDVSTLDEAQRRSMANQKKVCKCGKKVADVSGRKVGVYAGFKKRSRCRKCEGCTAPKCRTCIHCLTPSNKQSCEKRICLFPIIPKCPCFD